MTHFNFSHGLNGIVHDEQVFLDVQPLFVHHAQRLATAEAMLMILEGTSGVQGSDMSPEELHDLRVSHDAQQALLEDLAEAIVHSETAGVRMSVGLTPHGDIEEAAQVMDDQEVEAFVKALREISPDDFK